MVRLMAACCRGMDEIGDREIDIRKSHRESEMRLGGMSARSKSTRGHLTIDQHTFSEEALQNASTFHERRLMADD